MNLDSKFTRVGEICSYAALGVAALVGPIVIKEEVERAIALSLEEAENHEDARNVWAAVFMLNAVTGAVGVKKSRG